jgi:electron transport complex protein RnfE
VKNSNFKRLWGIFTNGFLQENPLLILLIGLCSAIAVSTEVANGIGMGLAIMFVLLMSELIISLFRKNIPASIRIPVFIVIAATFTTVVDYTLKAWFPDLSKSLGIFIPLIVVQCIIMGRLEAFASKNPVHESFLDALGMGLGYTWVLIGISAVRELFGSGTLLGYQIFPDTFEPILFFILPPGGFFVFALFISLNAFLKARLRPKESNTQGGAE